MNEEENSTSNKDVLNNGFYDKSVSATIMELNPLKVSNRSSDDLGIKGGGNSQSNTANHASNKFSSQSGGNSNFDFKNCEILKILTSLEKRATELSMELVKMKEKERDCNNICPFISCIYIYFTLYLLDLICVSSSLSTLLDGKVHEAHVADAAKMQNQAANMLASRGAGEDVRHVENLLSLVWGAKS